MGSVIDDARVLRWRMHSQFAERGGTVAEIARRSVGIQAQDAGAARLALRARGLREAAAVARAYEAGEVVSSWLMRGTLHLVPAEDLRPLLALLGERNAAAGARRRRELGLTEDVCRRALAALPEVLGTPPGRSLSRAELVAALNERGAGIEPEGQAPAHLMAFAAARGLLHRGADVAPREPGYVLMEQEQEQEQVSAERVAEELALHYAGAFGPAGPADFAHWSGLTLTTARRAFERAGLPEAAPGLHTAPGATVPPAGPPLVRLLGAYDSYLLGYRDRELMLDQSFARLINAGGGVVRPALVADGKVLGTWRRDGPRLVVDPFAGLPAAVLRGLRAEAVDLGRFLGEGEPELRVLPSE